MRPLRILQHLRARLIQISSAITLTHSPLQCKVSIVSIVGIVSGVVDICAADKRKGGLLWWCIGKVFHVVVV